MKLLIVPELTEDSLINANPDEKVIDYKMFNSLEFHPFIATNTWDKVIIKLKQGLMSGYIKQLLSKNNVIEIILDNNTEIDYDLINKLIEVFPNKCTDIRRLYMSKKDIIPLLKEVGVIFV